MVDYSDTLSLSASQNLPNLEKQYEGGGDVLTTRIELVPLSEV